MFEKLNCCNIKDLIWKEIKAQAMQGYSYKRYT